MFAEAWRLERDYFYDRGMHGVDWQAMREKYAPLVDRVTEPRRADRPARRRWWASCRRCTSSSAAATSARARTTSLPASLGAALARDEAAGGYRVEHIYQTDPDCRRGARPAARGPASDVEGGRRHRGGQRRPDALGAPTSARCCATRRASRCCST